MQTIYACSSNPGKLREFNLVAIELGVTDFQLVTLPGLKNIPPPEENGKTFEENAGLKAQYYSKLTDELVLADDSGLEVLALGGAPGVYSARYAGTHATDQANNELLLHNMATVADRTASFVCSIAIARHGNLLHTVRGSVEGQLLHTAAGGNGFGYDPLFFFPPFGCSFAELDDKRKFSVSHRGKALRKTFSWLSGYDQQP